VVSRQFNARYNAFFVPNKAHILQFTLCDLWSRPYTKYFQHRIFRLQYSAEGSSPATGDISTVHCAMWTVVPAIYNVITAPHIQASIFNWIYLRYHWRYADIWMRLILQSWWQMQRTFSTLRYLNCGPGHIQCNYSSAYSGFHIQLNVSALLLEICRQINAPYTANFVPSTAHILQITVCELCSRTYTM
jgi:hypothetical protein